MGEHLVKYEKSLENHKRRTPGDSKLTFTLQSTVLPVEIYTGSAVFEKLGNHWSTEKTEIILNY